MQLSVEQLMLESTMGRTLAERSETILALRKQLGDALTDSARLKAENESLKSQLDGLTKKKGGE